MARGSAGENSNACVTDEDRRFYVYIVFRLDGTPCYVGKGRGDRWQQHNRLSHNPVLRRIIAKSGKELPVVKVREFLSENEAYKTEIAFIAVLGKQNQGGMLVNMTDGGDGVRGRKQTFEQIEKLRQSRLGRILSEDTKAKIRQSLKGRPKTIAHNAAVSAAKKGKSGISPTAITRSKMSISQAAKWTQERRASNAQRVREWNVHLTDEQKAQKSRRISAALTGKKLSPEHRAKISATQKGRPRGPMPAEQRAKLSAAKKGKPVRVGPMSDAHKAAIRAGHAARRAKLAGEEGI